MFGSQSSGMSTVVADVQVCILFDPNGNQSKNHPRLHHPAGGGSLCKEADDVVLRSLAHAAFQRQGLAGHILEIRHGQLDADTANLRLSVAVVAHGTEIGRASWTQTRPISVSALP